MDGSAGDLFGLSVGVDGDYSLVSAGYDDLNGTDSGSVYLYDLSTGKQLQKFEPSSTQAPSSQLKYTSFSASICTGHVQKSRFYIQ